MKFEMYISGQFSPLITPPKTPPQCPISPATCGQGCIPLAGAMFIPAPVPGVIFYIAPSPALGGFVVLFIPRNLLSGFAFVFSPAIYCVGLPLYLTPKTCPEQGRRGRDPTGREPLCLIIPLYFQSSVWNSVCILKNYDPGKGMPALDLGIGVEFLKAHPLVFYLAEASEITCRTIPPAKYLAPDFSDDAIHQRILCEICHRNLQNRFGIIYLI